MCGGERWKEVRDLEGNLVLKVDPKRAVVEVKKRGFPPVRVDLTRYGVRPEEEVDGGPEVG